MLKSIFSHLKHYSLFYKRMNILVTGGCGFIGSNFINYMLKNNNNIKIFNIDCLNYCANESNVVEHSNYKFIKGNITSKDLVLHILNEYVIDAIIHFAAQSHVDNSFDNSLKTSLFAIVSGSFNCCKTVSYLSFIASIFSSIFSHQLCIFVK